ncbi:MAG: hypothetical protein SGPRY_013056, partial [Prymnesium sp.]
MPQADSLPDSTCTRQPSCSILSDSLVKLSNVEGSRIHKGSEGGTRRLSAVHKQKEEDDTSKVHLHLNPSLQLSSGLGGGSDAIKVSSGVPGRRTTRRENESPNSRGESSGQAIAGRSGRGMGKRHQGLRTRNDAHVNEEASVKPRSKRAAPSTARYGTSPLVSLPLELLSPLPSAILSSSGEAALRLALLKMPSETSPAAESNKAHFTLDDALQLYRLRLPECNVDLEPDDDEERPSAGSRIRCRRRSSVDFLGNLVAQSRTLALAKDER